jgi:hypothetical protein
VNTARILCIEVTRSVRALGRSETYLHSGASSTADLAFAHEARQLTAGVKYGGPLAIRPVAELPRLRKWLHYYCTICDSFSKVEVVRVWPEREGEE